MEEREWFGHGWESANEASNYNRGSWDEHHSWEAASRSGRWAPNDGEGQSRPWQTSENNVWCSHTREDSWMSDTACADWVMEPTSTHCSTLIFLHSCHGSPQHTTGFLEDLREYTMLDEQHLRVVAPCAPRRITELDEDGTFQWFEYRTEHMLAGADQDDIDKAQLLEQRQRLLLLLKNELQKLPLDGRMVIGGLSQGASMVSDLLLHLVGPPDKRLRGAFFKRGFVQRESVEDLPANTSIAAFTELPVLATHGIEDDWVPFIPAQKSYDLLRERGGVVTFLAIPGLKHNGFNNIEAQTLAEFVVSLLQPSGG